VVAMVAAAALATGSHAVAQETRDLVFADSARVDSLRASVSPDRVEEYRRRAAGEDDPRRWYDLGAILLLAGDWEGAIEPLERVVSGPESDVDESASYNLGVAHGTGSRPPEVARAGGRDERGRPPRRPAERTRGVPAGAAP
jgi:hypothetical protein